MNIKGKILFIILVTTFFSTFTGLTFLYLNNYSNLLESNKNEIMVLAEMTAMQLVSPLVLESKEEAYDRISDFSILQDIETVIIYKADGSLFTVYSKKKIDELTTPSNIRDLEYEEYEDHAFINQEIFLNENIIGHLIIISNDQKINTYLANFAITFMIIFILILLIAYIMALSLHKVFTKPINILTMAAKKIADQSDYGIQVSVPSDDEISSLCDNFNTMVQKIKDRELYAKKLREELEDTNDTLRNKNEEMEQIIYITSHDLRSPLVNIQGFNQELDFSIDELKEKLSELHLKYEDEKVINRIIEEDVKESQEYISASTKKMEALLKGLLSLSRISDPKDESEIIDMNQIVDEVIRNQKFNLIDNVVDIIVSDLSSCYGNPSQINQLFTNIIENAVKYRNKEKKAKIEISSNSYENHSIYIIKDNGIGIHENNLNKIFNVFFRVNEKNQQGDGLGLAIVKKIVDINNGKIWVESEINEGTTFFIQLNKYPKINE